MASTLLIETYEGVQTITLDEPARLNPLSKARLQELTDVLRTAERDDAVRAVVLTGAGRAFSAGADVAEFEFGPGEPPQPPDLGDLLRRRVNPLILRIRALPKPVIAAVNGVAAGAGMSLALSCDLRFAAQSARLIQAFVGIGLVPDAGSTYFLTRLVGASKALELAWSGEPVSAPEALDLGLVNRVYPDEQLLPETQAFAGRLAGGPATALALMKRGFSQAHELTLERVLELEAGYQTIASRSPHFAEGVAAFRGKRAPQFGVSPTKGS